MKATLFIGLTLAVATTANGQCIQGDINGDGVVNGIDLAYVLQNWNQSCPAVITSVTPSQGLPAGGTVITITGEQLGGVQGVTIGGVPATNVVGVNSTTITAVTPPSKSLGPKDVVVTTSAGSATLAGGFLYTQLDWGTVLEVMPDPAVITDPDWRERIIATGLPWRVRDNASQIEMLLVPPGTFMMGCSPSLQWACDPDENPVHEVTLTQPFYLSRFEVTQAQWTAVMGANPSRFQGQPDSPSRPVEKVSWNMIQNFEATTGLRLPSEAEWEYSCRAGATTAFNLPPSGTDDDGALTQLGWVGANSGGRTHPVGQKLSNDLGFHDMHGNVYEWTEDWYSADYYGQGPSTNPEGPSTGLSKVMRGGSWFEPSSICRSSHRGPQGPSDARDDCGFRPARTP